MTAPSPPDIKRYGGTWIQHPDGLSYGPLDPGDDEQADCAYPPARHQAAMETGLSRRHFP
jgi:hypothetical protein